MVNAYIAECVSIIPLRAHIGSADREAKERRIVSMTRNIRKERDVQKRVLFSLLVHLDPQRDAMRSHTKYLSEVGRESGSKLLFAVIGNNCDQCDHLMVCK